MNNGRDPLLESLFNRAEHDLVEDEFTAQVMDQVAARRRNVLIGRFAIVALLIALEVLLSSPLQDSAGAITQFLNMSLFDLGSGKLALFIAPLNSVAGLIGMLLLGSQVLYRRMMR